MKNRLESLFAVYERHRKIAECGLFPVVLLLYPFIGMLQGVDLTDTTYSLGNYRFMERIDPMWVIATYLPHVTGRLILHLPFGNTMAGFHAYCTLLICATALAAYVLLSRLLPAPAVFAGVWIAESLFWCPRAVLYNTMTCFFFTLGTLLLLRALTNETESGRLFLLAGVCFGLNVTVRLPNIVHVVMIVLLFVHGHMTGRGAPGVIKRFLLCVGGFFAGFLVPFLAICLRFGSYAYSEMVISLFSMSETAREYSLSGMLLTTLNAYANTVAHMAILIPCMAAGVVMFTFKKESAVAWKKAAFVAGLLILARYYLGKGVYTFNYWYYDCMFQAGMMFLIVSCILFVLDLMNLFSGTHDERILSLAALISILVLPIGSNNYTFPVLNCLFLIAPASLCCMMRARRAAYETSLAAQHFVWVSALTGMVLVLAVQGMLFHFRFSFRDGMDGTVRNTRITEIPKLYGMMTTEENARRLTGLYAFIRENGYEGTETLLFGDIPGMAYLFDLPPAVFTSWPDLESNLTERFDAALTELSTPPLVIVRPAGADMYEHSERKYNLLLLYMEQNGYETVYDADGFKVYAAPGRDGS